MPPPRANQPTGTSKLSKLGGVSTTCGTQRTAVNTFDQKQSLSHSKVRQIWIMWNCINAL